MHPQRGPLEYRTVPVPAAFNPSIREVVQTHQTSIWRYLRFLGCPTDEAEDLLQDTFVTALRKPFEYRDPAAAIGYLRAIARNLFLKRARDLGRRVPHVELDAAEEVWAEVAADEHGDGYMVGLRKCLTQLQGRAHQALQLRYRDNLSRDDIARGLGISPHGVKSLLQRSRRALRRCIEADLSPRRES